MSDDLRIILTITNLCICVYAAYKIYATKKLWKEIDETFDKWKRR